MSKLVIVESPAKAKSIGKLLGSNYKVLATVGHIRDLPKSKMGVDIENNFEPNYINIRGKGDVIKALKAASKKADKVLLATDPDREGEAIAWHLSYILGLPEGQENRVVFREITKDAIKQAVKQPRAIDTHLVDAQQARRVLDRLVGYSISPLLWRKVKKGLSAGRVQSVANMLICQREEKIRDFVPEEYWTIDAHTLNDDGKAVELSYFGINKSKKAVLSDKNMVDTVLAQLKGADISVEEVEQKLRKYAPLPPYTTSTLQQDAANKLGFSTKKTMAVAQSLYEGKNIPGVGTIGLITYMRTDSTRVSEEAVAAATSFIAERYGKEYLGTGAKVKKQKNMQDAHEAIRPTVVDLTVEQLTASLTSDEQKLYNLIWRRFIASQMADSEFLATNVVAKSGSHYFKASGSLMQFPGYTKVFDVERTNEKTLPEIKKGEVLNVKKFVPEQHFTSPPPRYTEASLVKEMEEKGIGRPSTYAPTITTVLSRGYVAKEKKSLYPTELGFLINEIMESYFNKVINVDFTAEMETDFDKVEEGTENWKTLMQSFYKEFEPLIQKADDELEKVDVTQKTDIPCPKCGQLLLIRESKFGKFYACSAYPQCDYTKPILKEIGVTCPKCGKGQVVERKSKKLKVFFGCSEFPACDYASWNEPVDEKCPICSENKVKYRGAIVCRNKH